MSAAEQPARCINGDGHIPPPEVTERELDTGNGVLVGAGGQSVVARNLGAVSAARPAEADGAERSSGRAAPYAPSAEADTNYIDALALEIQRRADPNPSADWFPLYRIYAVLALAKGTATTMTDVHDAWSAFMAGLDPHHRALIPFADLGAAVQSMDWPFVEAIHHVAKAARPASAAATEGEAAAIEQRDLAWVQRTGMEDRLRDAERTVHALSCEALELAAELHQARLALARADAGEA